MTKVSVIIPTYNCAGYLPKAIDSVLTQTYKNYEIIIINDGSIDNTEDIIKNYIKKYPDKIESFYQENSGVSAARNKGIEKAQGKYIALLDADDEFIPETLEKCRYFIEQYKADWCITDIYREESYKSDILASSVPVNDYIYNILEDCYKFIKRAFFFTKGAITDIGGFDNEFKIFEDWDLFIRLLEANKGFVHINEPLYIYKIRQKSLVKNNTAKVLLSLLQIANKHHKRLADSGHTEIARVYSKYMWRLGGRYLHELRDIKKSFYCMQESMKYGFDLNRLIHGIFFNVSRILTRDNS